MKTLLLAAFCIACSLMASGQDTLPNFTVEDKGGGRVIVSWANPYPNLIQIAVQRSYDSIQRFSTVYSSTSPELPVNGYSDKVVPGLRVYYRIFYVMKGGAYYFTKSKRAMVAKVQQQAVVDSRRDQINDELVKGISSGNNQAAQYPPDKKFYLQIPDAPLATFNPMELSAFRDSILRNTKDTLYQLTEDTLALARYVPPFVQRTSEFVFTDKEGYIIIKLPDAEKKVYQVTFLEEDETPVLDIKPIKESYLILDKTNFYHGGWYKFEIREAGRIKERNKIFLPREFRP